MPSDLPSEHPKDDSEEAEEDARGKDAAMSFAFTRPLRASRVSKAPERRKGGTNLETVTRF